MAFLLCHLEDIWRKLVPCLRRQPLKSFAKGAGSPWNAVGSQILIIQADSSTAVTFVKAAGGTTTLLKYRVTLSIAWKKVFFPRGTWSTNNRSLEFRDIIRKETIRLRSGSFTDAHDSQVSNTWARYFGQWSFQILVLLSNVLMSMQFEWKHVW